jgi:molybdopterin-guanine dinucleotide biosynthesis protein A
MIFRTLDPEQWHPVFAWWPTPLNPNEFAWMQTVERRLTSYNPLTGSTFEYRRCGNPLENRTGKE